MFSCSWCLTLGLLGVAGALLYVFFVWNFGHWTKRNVREAKSAPLLGSFPSSLTQSRHMAYDVNDIYSTFKKTENFVGVYSSRTPQLLVLSPEYVHKIYVNDFKSFHDNEFAEFVNPDDIILANNPFSLTGEKWKERRAEITPGLTANRIKNAYPVTLEVCKRFNDYIRKQLRMAPKDGIDTNELCLRFTSEVVTDCVLGVKAQSLTDKPTPILGMIQKLFETTTVFIFYSILVGLMPFIGKIYKMRFFPKHVEKFFFNLMQQSVDLRRSQAVDRVDFLNYLLQLQEKKQMSTPEMTSHVMTFLLDGFITTASTISHCLLLLARNPTTQKRLREEIAANLDANGEMSFEKLSELPYLDACIHETLRMFSAVSFTTKRCTEDYEMTNKDGTKLQLKAGEVVLIPTFSLHRDEQFYQQAGDFRPDRFLPENGGVKKYREQGVYLGFGDGPRVCLGMRFALTQSKAAIVEVIRNFNITVNPKTRADDTLDPKSFIGKLKGGIWLDFEPRN